MLMARSFLPTSVALLLTLSVPAMARASESEPAEQLPAVEARPLDAATLAALGITESPEAEAAGLTRPVAPESGAWSWAPGQYSYDGSGNITAIGAEAAFFYDMQGRLVDATLTRPPASEHREFVYDPFGNRNSMTTGSSTISTTTSSSTNHLTGLNAAYDAAGNLTQIQPPGQSILYQYKYDALGVLYEVKAANVAETPKEVHIYTADDERLWTFDMAVNSSHWKVRDLDGKVVRDYYVAGTTWSLSRDYIYRDGMLLAAVTPDDTLNFSLDHLGTPRVITGAGRVRLGFHHYMPFGEEWTDQSGVQEGEPMKFTGHERDTDVAGGSTADLDYMHSRFYSAAISRFLTLDPAKAAPRRPQSWNRYAYVENNPLTFVDPTGMSLFTWIRDVFRFEDSVTVHAFTTPPPSYQQDVAGWRSMNRELDRWVNEAKNLKYLRPGDLYSNKVTLHGLEAFADGVIPDLPGCGEVCDPFAYNGFYDEGDPGMRSAQVIGVLTRDVEVAIAGASLKVVSGGGTWLNKGRYLRAGESFTKGKTWFAIRGQWVDRVTGQTAKHVYLWILRTGR
jgi:RHS repeat-associated protein